MRKYGLKLAIVFMVIMALAVVAILLYSIQSTNSLVSGILDRQSATANHSFVKILNDYQSDALERAEMIAGSDEVISAILDGDMEKLKSALMNLSTGLDLITLCDAEGNVLARTHNDKTGDSVLNQKAISTALNTGKGISTIEPGTVIGLSTRGSAAIKDNDGNIIGALTCGHDLSQPKYIDQVKEMSGCEATFYANEIRMSTTLLDDKGERAVGTSAIQEVIDAVITQKGEYKTQIELYGTRYQAYYTPLIVDNAVIGMLLTGVSVGDILDQERMMVVFIICAIAMLAMVVAVTAFIIRWITKRTQWYENILDSIPFALSITDMNRKWTFINAPVEQMLNKKRDQMIGKPCSEWGAAICNTDNCGINCANRGQKVTNFDQGGMDFQVNVDYLHDAKGKTIGHIEVVQDITKVTSMQKAQTKLVGQIKEVSESFILASQQIADGAGTIAQGSTEQAATVHELSNAISNVAEKTKENAQTAEEAARLTDGIRTKAERGSEQMGRMTEAVKEINDASQSINKVIKVIDDIAFQTNILALNAAVEAARAGQHGKGFAVVAEEVRNLAAKSAEAAKDTSTLINNSMEKAEQGMSIADETAASLSEIVDGVTKSSEMVRGIAQASMNQTNTIAEIDSGIDQVAQVIQQNSATAEEFAAAGQELSGHTGKLHELVTQFDENKEE